MAVALRNRSQLAENATASCSVKASGTTLSAARTNNSTAAWSAARPPLAMRLARARIYWARELMVVMFAKRPQLARYAAVAWLTLNGASL